MTTQVLRDTFMLLSSKADAVSWQEVALAFVNMIQVVMLTFIAAKVK